MARNISTTFKNHIFNLESDDVVVLLLEFSHPDMSPNLRLAVNDADITSNGELFTRCNADVTLPADVEGRVLQTQIRLTNVSRDFTSLVRDITSTVDLVMRVVLASDPDTVEVEYTNFKLRGTELNAVEVVGTFSQDTLENIQYGWRFNTEKFSNIHQLQR